MEVLQVTVEAREADSSWADDDTNDWDAVEGVRRALSVVGDDFPEDVCRADLVDAIGKKSADSEQRTSS